MALELPTTQWASVDSEGYDGSTGGIDMKEEEHFTDSGLRFRIPAALREIFVRTEASRTLSLSAVRRRQG